MREVAFAKQKTEGETSEFFLSPSQRSEISASPLVRGGLGQLADGFGEELKAVPAYKKTPEAVPRGNGRFRGRVRCAYRGDRHTGVRTGSR